VIGENHVVKNNYFSGLKGFKDKFRAPLTVVNGVENSPLNGYFQVKNLSISGNQFVNCEGPAIRFGSGRRDALLVPTGIVMENNFIFSKAKMTYPRIDYVTQPSKIESKHNFTNLKAKGYQGWESSSLEIKTNSYGIMEIIMDGKEISMATKLVGENEVGPVWLRSEK
jgi:hypothetical protein